MSISTAPPRAAVPPGPLDAPRRDHRAPASRGPVRRLLLGSPDGPAWVRPSVLGLLLVTAVLYTWQLSASGYANSFYAAAVQAGTKSWKAWFFGSLDSANSITVDKPPAALWVMGLSARVFGFNSWSLLVPQAVEGVAAVGVLFAAVRRVAGPVAGLVAGAALALTPAAVLIFRFDNPDALLVLLMTTAAYCLTRALDGARTRWVALAGLAIGFAFLTKSAQSLLPVPGLAAAYLLAAPTGLWRRVRQLLLAGVGIVVGAGWWLAVVALWPASSRPYIGGSTNDSALELAFGYNGLGRLFGGSGNSSGGGSSSSGFGGATGLGRLFRGEFGYEISWLLPAALIALVAGLVITARRPRTDTTRAALVLWGGWLLVTGLVFSYMQGTIHPYYTVALAPGIAGTLAVGSRALWTSSSRAARPVLALLVAATTAWGAVLLRRDTSYPAWVLVAAVVLGAAAVAALLLAGRASAGARSRSRRGRRLLATAAVTAVLAVGLPTGAWAYSTSATAHTGSIPTAVASSSTGGAGGGGAPSGSGSHSGGAPSGTKPSGTKPSGTKPSGTAPSGSSTSSTSTSGTSTSGTSTSSTSTSGTAQGGGGATSSAALVKALKATTSTWSAAVVGDSTAATLELSTDTAVMAIGGWSGTDDSISLAQFTADVAQGKIHYFIAGSGAGAGGSSSSSSASKITAWVEAHYTATTIGGTTVYDLTATAS